MAPRAKTLHLRALTPEGKSIRWRGGALLRTARAVPLRGVDSSTDTCFAAPAGAPEFSPRLQPWDRMQ